MSCCTGEDKTKTLDGNLSWRSSPDVQHHLPVVATLRTSGKWVGDASGVFNFGDPNQCDCGDKATRGVLTVRIHIELECMESESAIYISARLRISHGTTNFTTSLRPVLFTCTPFGHAEWLNVWFGILGDCIFTIDGRDPNAN